MTHQIDTTLTLNDDALDAVSGGGFKNAVTLGFAGAQTGALGGGLFGPFGAAVGGLVGAVGGAVGGSFIKDDPKGDIHIMV